MQEYTLIEEPRWYAVSTRSRHEKIASATLNTLGIPHFLPLIEEERQWSDRKKPVMMPLFPGYVFVQIARTSDIQLSVRKVPGIVSFVGNQNGPLAVPESEIENVRGLLTRGGRCSPSPFFEAGEQVRVARGPFAGVEGKFVRCGARSRVVVSVQIIQQAVSVEVAASDVKPISLVPAWQPQSPSALAEAYG